MSEQPEAAVSLSTALRRKRAKQIAAELATASPTRRAELIEQEKARVEKENADQRASRRRRKQREAEQFGRALQEQELQLRQQQYYNHAAQPWHPQPDGLWATTH